jgi:hypothetical protein
MEGNMNNRTQRIKGTWSIDGAIYTGRTIDIDTLLHLGWHDDVLASFNVSTAEQALSLNPTPWEQNFIHSLLEQFNISGRISEKQSVVWDKIALKLSVTEPGNNKKDARDRGSLGDPSAVLHVPTATTDEIPF